MVTTQRKIRTPWQRSIEWLIEERGLASMRPNRHWTFLPTDNPAASARAGNQEAWVVRV